MSKHKFKVGDEVVFRPGYCEGAVWLAVVSAVDEADDIYPYEVDLGDRRVWAHYELDEVDTAKCRVDAGPRTM